MQYYCLLKNTLAPSELSLCIVCAWHNPPASNINNQPTIITYYTDIDFYHVFTYTFYYTNIELLSITNKYTKLYS